MARKKRGSEPMVAEAAVKYETKSSLAEVLWMAFKSLPEEDQGAFLRKLLDDAEWYEEIEDAVSIVQARGEPTRPYTEIREEMRREGLL